MTMLGKAGTWVVCGAIRAYQLTLSKVLGGQCRFEPSCSNYMLEAVRRHGVGWGIWLGLRRIGRCHPWHEGGLDPVPAERPEFRIFRKRKTR